MFDVSAAPESHLDGLNVDQLRAATHGEGPLLVIAGAGSGKTRTLASRVAHLIDRGVDPDRILLLTFTRRAASEMIRRAEAVVDVPGAAHVWGGTFHAIANRLLRAYGPAVGLDEGFTVIDRADTESMFGMLRSDLGFSRSKTRFPRKETIASVYSRVVNSQTPLGETLESRYPWCASHGDALKELFTHYTERKRESNVVDYDDLLVFWRALMTSEAAGVVRDRFDQVLVDEYQDTNLLQADILFDLCGANGNLTVVGDDAQSIYSFRAARVENILGFTDRYPSATVVTLDRNYRSTPEVLDATNAVIGASETAFDKQLWTKRPPGPVPELVTCYDEAAQADWVCDRVLELRERGIALREQAVLFRTGHHSGGLELELGRRQIPFVKFGGLTFMDHGQPEGRPRLESCPPHDARYRAGHRSEGEEASLGRRHIGRCGRARGVPAIRRSGVDRDPRGDRATQVGSRGSERERVRAPACGPARRTASVLRCGVRHQVRRCPVTDGRHRPPRRTLG